MAETCNRLSNYHYAIRANAGKLGDIYKITTLSENTYCPKNQYFMYTIMLAF